jgi:hypothetical protein
MGIHSGRVKSSSVTSRAVAMVEAVTSSGIAWRVLARSLPTFGPPLAKHCTLLAGPASVRISTGLVVEEPVATTPEPPTLD